MTKSAKSAHSNLTEPASLAYCQPIRATRHSGWIVTKFISGSPPRLFSEKGEPVSDTKERRNKQPAWGFGTIKTDRFVDQIRRH